MPTGPDDLPPCAGCGRCCHLVVALVQGVDRVPEEFAVEREGGWCMDQRGDGACVALDPLTRLCTIYETRPRGLPRICPGQRALPDDGANGGPALTERARSAVGVGTPHGGGAGFGAGSFLMLPYCAVCPGWDRGRLKRREPGER